jgi:hypothetical protein
LPDGIGIRVTRHCVESEVRFRGQTGKHLLVLRVTGFDPKRSSRASRVPWPRRSKLRSGTTKFVDLRQLATRTCLGLVTLTAVGLSLGRGQSGGVRIDA